MEYVSYSELTPGRNFPLMKESLEKQAYASKRIVLEHLKNGNVELARASRKKDVFTGEIIPAEVLLMSDGKFRWSNELAWYVEKHNLRLPKEFEDHILTIK